MIDFKWRHILGEIILWGVRWYCKYGISQPAVAGYKVSAFLRFEVEADHCRAAAEYLAAQQNVVYVSVMGGRHNIMSVMLARAHSQIFDDINGPWGGRASSVGDKGADLFPKPKHRYDLMRLPD